jgi:hypothetical protein
MLFQKNKYSPQSEDLKFYIIILIKIISQKVAQNKRVFKVENNFLRHLKHYFLNKICLLYCYFGQKANECIFILSLCLFFNLFNNLTLFFIFLLLFIFFFNLNYSSLYFFLFIKDNKVSKNRI